jgi:hypothetical protein
VALFLFLGSGMNPKHAIHRQKLDRAIQFYRKQLSPYRANRTRMVRAFAGAYYGDDEHRSDLANFLLQAVEAYMQSVLGGSPKVLAETKIIQQRGFAAHFAAAINNLLTEIHAGETFSAIGMDAFFGLGIGHVRLADDGYVELEQDIWSDPGKAFFSRISFDDWVHDTQVSDYRFCQLAGNMYRMDWEVLRDSDLYDQKVVASINPSSKRMEQEEERTSLIQSGQEVDDDEYRPMIDVVDIWQPREKLVCTYACRRNMELLDKPPLAERDWTGSEEGPFRFLNIAPVPDNIMPTCPASNLFNMARLLNTLLRKQNNQAKRGRVIPIYEPDAKDDAMRLKDAADGQWTAVKRKDGVGVVTIGGVDQANMLFSQTITNLFDRFASGGNLKSQLGLGPQSDTASQDAMINQQVQANQGRTVTQILQFVERCVRDLGKVLWDHPTKSVNSYVRFRGKEYQSNWEPDDREGDLSDYTIEINPYSLPYRSPMQKASELKALVAEISQLVPMMQAAGGNPAEFVAQMAELYCQPELNLIFPFDQLPGRVPEAGMEQGASTYGKPNGDYTRTNVNGGAPENSALMGQMSFGGEQPMAQVA